MQLKTVFILAFLGASQLHFGQANEIKSKDSFELYTIGSLKSVMRNGELFGKISLDSIRSNSNIYGLGPLAYLKGEIFMDKGIVYESRVADDNSVIVQKSEKTEAPFFVWAKVEKWESRPLPENIKTIDDLEKYLTKYWQQIGKAFPFKLAGTLKSGQFHIQNLPSGVKVSSPKEAHRGQVQYPISNSEVEILGFYSQNHQGIFTHHDSFVHLHMITKDHKQMGHLDSSNFKQMKLLLPKGIYDK